MTDYVLVHHGVKGMKWGVRKKRERSRRRLSPKAKRALIIAGAAVAIGTAAVLANNHMVKKTVAEIAEQANLAKKNLAIDEAIASGTLMPDVAISKGKSFFRVSGIQETSLKDPSYATYLQKDVDFYREFWGWGGPDAKHYSTKITATQDVKIAGHESMLRTLSNNMDKSLREIIRLDHSETSAGNFIDRQAWRKASATDVAMLSLKGNAGESWKNRSGKATLENLSRAGYSGFTDMMDSTGEQQHPVVLFNPAVFKVTNKELTKEMRRASGRRLREGG